MRLSATDFHLYHRPSKCATRVYRHHSGDEEGPPSPYSEVLMKLGLRHEQQHLETFPSFVDLSQGNLAERASRTKKTVHSRAPVLYQPVMSADVVLSGVDCEIVGIPDFLVLNDRGYTVRDSKISRRITEKDHPEILRQLELYGWLFEQTFGEGPVRMEVHCGTGDLIEVPYDGGERALQELGAIIDFKTAELEPYSPVGWSKCNGCRFFHLCWPTAEKNRDAALVYGVDQNLALALKNEGVENIEDLVREFDRDRLAQFRHPWGKSFRKVGSRASSILTMARAMATGQEIILEKPEIPNSPNYVMFDLEGIPPHLDDLDKIYIWGLQVFGERPGKYQAALAGFGKEGDREGWEDFLIKGRHILDDYGDIPFVHWHRYELDRLNSYERRYGDREGVAARVRKNLLDLLPITQKSVALPLPSYSLKVIERHIGFKRSQDEYGGDWAIAKFIEATESEDEDQRSELISQICLYNQEDLAATWAVHTWIKHLFV